MSEENGRQELRSLPLRTKEELSDFLDTIAPLTVVEIIHRVQLNKTDRSVGFYQGKVNNYVVLSLHEDVGKYAEPHTEIPVHAIQKITPYGTRTPYEAVCNIPQPPQRRKGRINLKSEFM